MDLLDAEVLATLQDDVCRPAVVEEAIRLALDALAPASHDVTRARLEADLATARRECERLAEAIGRGGPLDALLERLTARQAHCAAVDRETWPSACLHAHRSAWRPWKAACARSSRTGAGCCNGTCRTGARCSGRC